MEGDLCTGERGGGVDVDDMVIMSALQDPSLRRPVSVFWRYGKAR